MYNRFLCATFCAFIAYNDASVSFKPTATASVKEGNIVGGIEGLDLNWVGVLNLDEFVVGAKYALNAVKVVPESLFAKRSFNTAGSGKLTVDTNFDVAKNKLSLYSSWVSDKIGVAVSALGDSVDKLKEITISKSQDALLGADKFSSAIRYELQGKKTSFVERYARGDIAVELKFDNQDLDPIVTISKKFYDNVFAPSISVKTGTASYGWRRILSSGSVDAVLKIGDKLTVTWRDEAKSGSWVTKATVPLDDPEKKTKISVLREWSY